MGIVKPLDRMDKIIAIQDAAQCDYASAEVMLNRLEADGFTIYNKKRRLHAPRPPVAEKVTPTMQQEIRRLHKTSGLTQQQIAARLNVNIGRVFEALA